MTSEESKAVLCFACHKDTGYSLDAKIMRSDECPHCYASLHTCKMCHFYDPSAYNECRENQAERILEKEKPNFCDFYILRGSGEDPNKKKDDLLSAANSLFKD